MTILIKGMEMPPSDKALIMAYKDGRFMWIDLEGEKTFQYEAVEVPTPHGRLGDLDRLYKHIKAECNIYGKPTIGFEDGNKVLKIIADTRTVIEAEEQKGDNKNE